jgi:hypothetical protein
MNAASYAAMSHEELVQEACRLQQCVRVLAGPFRCSLLADSYSASLCTVQLDKEKKVSAAYAEELKRTREQAMAVVSRRQTRPALAASA